MYSLPDPEIRLKMKPKKKKFSHYNSSEEL